MDLNYLLSASAGNGIQLEAATRVLKKSQDLAKDQALSLINALPKNSPSPSGIGKGIDVFE